MNYIYVENDNIIGCGQTECLNKDIKNIKVSKQIYEKYLKDTDTYVHINGEIKKNPDYETLKKKEEIKNKINEVNEKLAILDLKRIRAVCEDEIRNEKTGETWLDFYNSQIYDLRTQLNSLEAQL